MMSTQNRHWDEGFKALLSFKEREGHCRVPRLHIEAGYRLGQWVTVQRYYNRQLLLRPGRKARLDAEGFIWSRRDWLWERAFAAMHRFKQREGHCFVPALHIEDGIKLGYWTSVQRRMKKKMQLQRKERLDEVGFVWSPRSSVHVTRTLKKFESCRPRDWHACAARLKRRQENAAVSAIGPKRTYCCYLDSVEVQE